MGFQRAARGKPGLLEAGPSGNRCPDLQYPMERRQETNAYCRFLFIEAFTEGYWRRFRSGRNSISAETRPISMTVIDNRRCILDQVRTEDCDQYG